MSAKVGAAVMTATSEAETSDADAGDAAESTVWTCIGDVSSNSSRWQEDASDQPYCGESMTAAVIAKAVVRHRLQSQGERDDMLCSMMEDAVEEEVPAQATGAEASYAAVVTVTVVAVALVAMAAKVAEAEIAAAAVKAAEAVEAKVETATEAKAATEAEAAATTKQQKWEQECAKAVRFHEKQQEWEQQYAKWERRWQRDGWWAALDERISGVEIVCAKQAHALMEMFKILETIKAQ